MQNLRDAYAGHQQAQGNQTAFSVGIAAGQGGQVYHSAQSMAQMAAAQQVMQHPRDVLQGMSSSELQRESARLFAASANAELRALTCAQVTGDAPVYPTDSRYPRMAAGLPEGWDVEGQR
jgi:hypothetical protein